MTPLVRLPKGLLLAFGLIGASLLLYSPNFTRPPIWDDHYFVLDQPFLCDPANLLVALDPRNLIRVLPVSNSARPVWLASVLLDRALLGQSFTALRVSNALWHGAGAALLALLAWELTGVTAAALVAGALFVLHPLHGEVVSIVNFRSDSVAFVFMMLALVLHLRSRRARWSAPWRIGSWMAFAFALLAKESAACLPFLLPLVEWASAPDREERVFSRWRVYASFALILSGYLYFRVPRSGYVTRDGADVFSRMQTSHPEVFSPVSQPNPRVKSPRPRQEPSDPPPWSRDMADPMTRLRTMAAVHGTALRRLIWPYPLQGDYAPKVVGSWTDPRLLLSVAAWAALLAAAYAFRRRRPLFSAGLLWVPAAMLPVSGMIMMTNLTADRYLYTASAGVCLAIASLFRPGVSGLGEERGRRGLWMLALELSAVWFVLSACRLKVFRNDWLFFATTAHTDPDVPRARLNLAVVQSGFGYNKDAERNYREAIRLWPRSRRAARLYADFLEGQGRQVEARRLRQSADEADSQRLSTTMAPPIPPPAHAASIP